MKTVAICGSTCVGKTTLINKLCPIYLEAFVIRERVEENPYFNHCADLKDGCMFKSQLMFYSQYLGDVAQVLKNNYAVVLCDRCIDEHYLISQYRYSIGQLSEGELVICESFAKNIKRVSPTIDKFIYLHCSKETALKRMRSRSEIWDKYLEGRTLERLIAVYDSWYHKLVESGADVMSVDTEKPFDIESIVRWIDGSEKCG